MLVIGAGLLVYQNSLHDEFIFDDLPHIVENPRIRQLWPPWKILTHSSRPVVHLSLAVNYAIGGLDPRGYHLFNVGIHILAALTLFGVVRLTLVSETLRSRWGGVAPWLAGMVSVIWLVHPLQTESVTYTIQRGESLMGLFYLLTLYCVIRSSSPSRSFWWQAGAVASCILGMASKPVMVTAPVVVLLYDRAFLAQSWREVIKHRWTLYASLAATWLLLPLLLANGASEWKPSAGFAYGGLPALQYALTQPGVILHYLRLAFWPHPLCFDYGWNYGWPSAQTAGDALPELMVVGALLAATAWAWWRKPALGFLGVWFFLILTPTSSFVSVADLVVEHRMYLPLAAVVTFVTAIGFKFGRNLLRTRQPTQRMIGWAVSGSAVFLLAVLTIQRNRDYRSELAIWQDTVVKCPNNPRAHYNFGVTLYDMGYTMEAIGQYEQAVRIKPDYADAHYNLGGALVKVGSVQEAIGHWQEVVRIKPDHASAHYNLGNALFQQGKPKEAIGEWGQALRVNPDYAEAHNDLAVALVGQDRQKEAIEHWEQALRIRPDYIDAHYNLGIVLEKTGRIRDALGHFEQVLRLRPDYAPARVRLQLARQALAQEREVSGER